MFVEQIITKEIPENTWESHLDVLDLIEILKSEMQKKLHNNVKVLTNAEIAKYNHIIKECENWEETAFNILDD